jgi:hypothetical protein
MSPKWFKTHSFSDNLDKLKQKVYYWFLINFLRRSIIHFIFNVWNINYDIEIITKEFEILDVNGDGQIDKEEFVRFLKPFKVD